MKKATLPLLALLLAGGLSFSASAQSERTTAETPPQITYEMLVSQYNFPVMQNTGNPELDQQNHTNAKDLWISQNKALYNRYNAQGVKGNRARRAAAQPIISPTN